eukprot:jgi/Ulvmu1/7067/UM033_0127.1
MRYLTATVRHRIPFASACGRSAYPGYSWVLPSRSWATLVRSHSPENSSSDHAPEEFAGDDEGDYAHARPIQEEDTGFGPRGVLLAGFSEQDAKAAAEWMREMEPDFRINHVTDDMMGELLSTALYDPNNQEMRVESWQQTTTLMPRICLMSGLSGAEQIAVANVWDKYAGSPTPFFAAAVPNSLSQPVRTVLQAIVDEYAAHAEDDPRLQPSSVMANVDSDQLKAVISKKMEKSQRKKEERQAKKDQKKPSSAAQGFG